MSIHVRVVDRTDIGEPLLSMARRWQEQRGIEPLADTNWLKVTCEDDDAFAPGEGSLLIVLPPCAIAPGDLLEVEGAEELGLVLPDMGSGEVPTTQLLGVEIEPVGDGWRASCPPAPAGVELFRLEPPEPAIRAFTAHHESLPGYGALIQGFGEHSVLNLTGVVGEIVARASVPVLRTVDFWVWIPRGLPLNLKRFVDRQPDVAAYWTPQGMLVWRGQDGRELLCETNNQAVPPIPDARPDHFAGRADGELESIAIAAATRLGAEAAELISSCRPAGAVVFSVDEEQRMLIRAAGRDGEMVTIEGPGFTTLGDVGTSRSRCRIRLHARSSWVPARAISC